MFDSPLFDSIELLYKAIADNRECNEDVINIITMMYCYINKPPFDNETATQKSDRYIRTKQDVRNQVNHIIENGYDD